MEFIRILIVLAAIALFFGTYILNSRTKVPDGCEDQSASKCSACSNTSCKSKNTEEVKFNEK